jgi:DNA-binding transcriptional MerR regulator
LSGEPLIKGPNAFRTIAEVSDMLDVAPHVLRFWEGKFPQLRPMTRAGGRRLYRPEDVALLRGIQALLAEDGYSIKGVQKLLRDQGVAHVRLRGGGAGGQDSPIAVIQRPAPPREETPPPGPLFDTAKTSASAGVTLRRALARLEQARAALDRISALR